MDIRFLDAGSQSWSRDVDSLCSGLGSPDAPTLFPPHFLKATFHRIGGRIFVLERRKSLVGACFLFPRTSRNGVREFTLRFHKLDRNMELNQDEIINQVEALLGGDKVVFYDPDAKGQYGKTTVLEANGVEIGHPDASEAVAIRDLQHGIWRSDPGLLYPSDIHSSTFKAGTSLIARVSEEPVGFLFGFYSFGHRPLPEPWRREYGADFGLESQLLGVLPEYRNRGIAFLLKRIQAEEALQVPIRIINWTVDPLQYGNAIFNFGRLKAIAFEFHRHYYTFKNVLNQVATSRFGITWLLETPRVEQALHDNSEATVLDLHDNPEIQKVNDGFTEFSLEEDWEKIAIEIPTDWTGLQNKDPDRAMRWEEASSQIFQHYLGHQNGKYMVTSVAQDGPRRYLVAERLSPSLLEKLGGR